MVWSRRKSRNAAGSVRPPVPRPIRVGARALCRLALRPSQGWVVVSGGGGGVEWVGVGWGTEGGPRAGRKLAEGLAEGWPKVA